MSNSVRACAAEGLFERLTILVTILTGEKDPCRSTVSVMLQINLVKCIQLLGQAVYHCILTYKLHLSQSLTLTALRVS